MAEIKLTPHVGTEQLPGGKCREVHFAQDRIFFGDACVGLVGRQTGAPICFIDAGHLSESDREAVAQFVNARRNESIDRRQVDPAGVGDEPEESDL